MFLDRLTRNDQPAEAQSPVQASGVTALVSFILVYWLDSRFVSSLGTWWAELLVYAFVPVLLAFIILYRSAWHRELTAVSRALLAGLFSCVIFAGVLLAIGVTMVLVALAYYSHFDGIMRFHY